MRPLACADSVLCLTACSTPSNSMPCPTERAVTIPTGTTGAWPQAKGTTAVAATSHTTRAMRLQAGEVNG